LPQTEWCRSALTEQVVISQRSPDLADPGILDAIALEAVLRRNGLVIVDREALKPVRCQFHREQPGQEGQRHDLPAAAALHELAWIGGVGMFERPCIEHIAAGTAIAFPANDVDMTIADRVAQRLGDPHHA
jgi:hypothetical protein